MSAHDCLKIIAITAVITAAGTAAALPPGGASRAQDQRPNILVIMADDLSPEDIGCYGNTGIKTPNIDRLAAEGTRFLTCYATPVCGPSRVLMMTGRYATHTGSYNMGDRPGAPKTHDPPLDFSDTEISFATPLRDAGYRTTIAGKWQLVVPMPRKIPATGYDTFLMWQIGHREGFGMQQMTASGPSGPGSRYYHPSMNLNGGNIVTRPTDFGPDMFVDFLLETITAPEPSPWLAY